MGHGHSGHVMDSDKVVFGFAVFVVFTGFYFLLSRRSYHTYRNARGGLAGDLSKLKRGRLPGWGA